jgi:hypothetical protein
MEFSSSVLDSIKKIYLINRLVYLLRWLIEYYDLNLFSKLGA